jgi:hypothetical protein
VREEAAHARGPEHATCGYALALPVRLEGDAVVCQILDQRVHPHFGAEALERLAGFRREVGRVDGQDPVSTFDQQHPGLARIDRPEVVAKRVARQLADRSRELDARGPCPHDDEV